MAIDVDQVPVEHLEHWLRLWTATHDTHVRAAVDLLIEHGHWLRSRAFRAAAVRIGTHETEDGAEVDNDDARISWRDAREAFDTDALAPASSTELAVLDLAIALGEDRYKLSQMGDANSADIATAVCRAVDAAPRREQQ